MRYKVVQYIIYLFLDMFYTVDSNHCVHVFVNQAKLKVNPLMRCFWECIMVYWMHIWLFLTILAITLEMERRADLLVT